MLNNLLHLIKNINQNYSNFILVVLAILSFAIAYNEFVLKRRPFIITEISYDINGDKWDFFVTLVNKGGYPGIAKITKAVLKIGDEEYPTSFTSSTVLAPNDKIKIAPIGNINLTGRSKILGHEYRSNRVEIILEVDSKSIGDYDYKYKTVSEYEVDVSSDKPIVKVLKEELL